ncbi:hypothetical protein PQ460_19690 [Paenibacillus sp. KACC 21273]|uniref:hypothetical protein n=1 Tax=Paenibacillus sp. KACC 21273 TaxID=3025665 RepID=UPI002365E72D|nr:hypothetical protein [Paenibacillus sp. KACC 21273]WDF50186.1 hypothetical protein PQ460_19690 [Paenibacillus sp. KACC 21273]
MNKPNQSLAIASILFLTLTMTACQKQTNAPAATDSQATPAISSTTENQQVDDNTVTDSAASSDDEATASVVEREPTKSFDMGMGDTRKATLTKSKDYSLYVFDGYTLDTATHRLQSTNNPKYYAEIEKVSSGSNLDELRNQGIKELTEYGEVKEYKGDQLAEGPMFNANLLLQVSDEKGVHDYIVWEDQQSKDTYIFRAHAPEGKESDTFLTPALTSLSSIMSSGDHLSEN